MTHPQLVTLLVKPGSEILDQLSPDDCHLIHMAMGISGEAGELLDCVKKAVIYRKPIDRDNAVEELGDLEFYMQGLRNILGVSREEVLQKNIEKLSARYSSLKYSDEQARNRADKS